MSSRWEKQALAQVIAKLDPLAMGGRAARVLVGEARAPRAALCAVLPQHRTLRNLSIRGIEWLRGLGLLREGGMTRRQRLS